MRIAKLKTTSSWMIFCALIMFFAHIVVPHYHDQCCDPRSNTSNICCINAELSGQANHDDSHHYCMATSIVCQYDTQKEVNLHLTALYLEHYGYIYSPIISTVEMGESESAPPLPSIILQYIFKKLPQRAPPAIA